VKKFWKGSGRVLIAGTAIFGVVSVVLLFALVYMFFNFKGPMYQGTPLHNAVQRGDLAEVHKLIQSGVDVNLPDDNRNTPLCEAVRSSNFEIADYLYSRGGSLDLPHSGTECAQELRRRTSPHSKSSELSPSKWIERNYKR